MNINRIGIITSGGDCGGLNAVIKGVAKTAINMGIDVVLIPNGYASLYNLNNIESLPQLTIKRLDDFSSSSAGSEAGHSRVKVKKIDDPNKYERIKNGLAKHAIDALVISGGDDSGSVMVDLSENGILCVHAPKTMDLDLQTYSVGGDSTINRIASFATDLKTTGRTHNRTIVMEVFGRYAGHTAFRGGLASEADAILIPEIPVDFDILYNHYKKTFTRRIENSYVKAGTYMVVVAEGLRDITGKEITDDSAGVDAFGHKKLAGASKYVQQELEKRINMDKEFWINFMKEHGMFIEKMYEVPEIRTVNPGHLVRSGDTSAYDVSFGKSVGAGAVRLLLAGITGVTVAGIDGGKIMYMPSKKAIEQNFVNLEELAVYEEMGICFGRKPVNYKSEFTEVDKVQRIY